MKRIMNKRGNEIIEASVVIPLVLLVVIIVLRMFTFYFEILTSYASLHKDALPPLSSESITTAHIGVHTIRDTVTMAPSHQLKVLPRKEIEVKEYTYCEDDILRAGEILGEE